MIEKIDENRSFVHQTSITLSTDYGHELVYMLGLWQLFQRGDSVDYIEERIQFDAIKRVLDELLFCGSITTDAADDNDLGVMLRQLERAIENVRTILQIRIVALEPPPNSTCSRPDEIAASSATDRGLAADDRH